MANPNMKKYDYMLEQNKNYMNSTALSTVDRKITYEELHESIEKYVKLLLKKGVRAGDMIGICALNVPESVYLIYALDIIGAIAVGFDPLASKEKLRKNIELVKPKFVITVDLQYRNFKSLEKALNFSTVLYSISDSISDKKLRIGYNLMKLRQGNVTLSKDRDLKRLLKADYSDIDVVSSKYVEDALSDIMFTGGSTGVSKGVELSSNGLNSVIEGMRYMYDDDFFTEKTYLGNIPFGHMAYGRAILHVALTNNMNFALTLNALPKDFYSELVRTQAHCAVGGPPHWTSLIEKENDIFVPRRDLKEGSLSNLQLATSGGEAKKKNVESAINNALKYCGSSAVVGDGLGATENWSVMLLNSGNCYAPGTIGSPISTLDIMLIDPVTGEKVKSGEIGLLYISGPSTMLGYYNNPKETREFVVYRDGKKWINIGDYLRETDTPNRYEYVGRQKRIFVSGIENIYSEVLEEVISTLPEVREVVVTPIPDDVVQFIPRYHISLYDDNIDIKEFEAKLEKLITTEFTTSWLPGSIEYTTKPLKRMTNSKIDVKYYEQQDKMMLESGKINNEKAKTLRLTKM